MRQCGKDCHSFRHAIVHESIPASQFNFLCSSLFFAARPFFATFFLLYPRLFSSSINEGCRRKNRRRCLCKCNAADKDSGNGKDGECSKELEHLQSLIVCELMPQNVRLWPKRTPAGSSATCGSASSHPLTSPFWALVHPQSLYIHLFLPKIISGCIGRVVWASQDGNSGDPAGPFRPSVANKGPRHGLSLSAASLRQANQTLCKRLYFVGTSLDD